MNRLLVKGSYYNIANIEEFLWLIDEQMGEDARDWAKEYLKPLKEANVDTIIMGCTHYPLLKDTIYDIMDGKVTLIDPGYEASLSLKKYLEGHNMLADIDDGSNHRFYVSDSVEGFEKMGSMFLHKEIKGLIEKIDIEKY